VEVEGVKLGLVGMFVVLPMLVLVPIITIFGGVAAITASQAQAQGGQFSASDIAKQDIPAQYLQLYQQAGATFNIDWTVLAGIGKIECDHGRSPSAGCPPGTVNSVGAKGPMQFLDSTWAKYGAGGDVYSPVDAIPATARFLQASGANDPKNVSAAVCDYNTGGNNPDTFQACMDGTDAAQGFYLTTVMSWANKYKGPVTSTGNGSGLEVVLPVPNVGWQQAIKTPNFPAQVMNDPQYDTNQCVGGAYSTWYMMHKGDGRWNSLPYVFGNANQQYSAAASTGWQVSNSPSVGAMVSFSIGEFGHIATVRAIDGGKVEIIEQNWVVFNPNLLAGYGTFDLRVISASDPSIIGFINSPGLPSV
jgi:surface antigen